MNQWIQNLVGQYKVDGLRIDTAKHIRKDFWPAFVQSAGVFSIGEVLDGVLEYPTWFPLTAAFTSPSGNMSALAMSAIQAQQQYKNGAFLSGAFLENHDQPRFQSLTQDQALVRNAMMWPFLQDGIPILYYGQEQGYTGGSDPSNRESLWQTSYDTSKPLVGHVKSLNAARKAAMNANSNYTKSPMTFIQQPDKATLAISKPPLVGLFTNVGSKSEATTMWMIPGSSGLFNGGERVTDVLSCKTVTAAADGGLSIKAENGMPQ
ncbi:hypothetical protein H0H81_003461, partial [Sphagnurus paluster]